MSTESDQPQWHPSDALLHRFVDGELRGAERTAVEALLAGDGRAYDDVGAFQRQNVLLQALFPRRMEDTMLPASALNLARGLRRRRTVRRAAAAAVAGLALFGAGTTGWHAQRHVEQLLRAPVVAVFPPHAVPAATGESAPASTPTMPPVPTATGSLPTEAPGWLGEDARRVPVHPPNLQSVGYQLVDGRADLTAYGPVIRFAYTPSEGGEPRLALTVASFGTDRQSLATTINPQHASLFWQAGPLLYALSGDVAPGRLLRVADAVRTGDQPGGTGSGQGAAPAAANGEAKGDAPALPVTPVADQGEASKEL